MFRRVVILVIIFFALSSATTRAQDTWVAKDGAVKNSELKDAFLNRDALYIATRNVLYKAKDLKERWESVFSLPQGGNNEINCLAGRARTIFVGTKKGLFRSDDYGATWKDVFRTILPGKNNIIDVELSRYYRTKVLIATAKGVFISDDLGNSWEDISGVLKNVCVKCVALNKESMYAGTESGLYIRKGMPEDWERVFIRNTPEKNEPEEPDNPADYDDNEKDVSIRSVAVNDNKVYICYGRRISCSDDEGGSWVNFPCEGLKGDINYILVSSRSKTMYCATEKGVFEFSNDKSRWLELYRGMSKTLSVSSIMFGSGDEKTLLAVTDKGLYSFGAGDYLMDKYQDIDKSMKTLKIIIDGEPTYKELQQAAIGFCDVSPEKIKSWQRNSRIKALVPKVSFGIDNHRSSNSEIYTSATRDYVSVGPDDTYNAFSTSVSWDLGNLIWSQIQHLPI